MKKEIILLLLLISFTFIVAFEPHFIDDPSLSPDGNNVVFAYRGDLWKVDSQGGTAVRLTDNPSEESNPYFSPNNKYIAYNSNRDGWLGLYYMPVEGGEAIQISDTKFTLMDWFSNSKDLLVRRYTPGFGYKFYKMDLAGNYEEFALYAGNNAHLNKDDSKLIFNRRGYTTRESYQGSVDGEIWIYDVKKNEYSQITDNQFTEIYPVFSSKSDKIYFAGSDGEIFQLYDMIPGSENTRSQLSAFSQWSVKDLHIAKDKEILVFTLFDEVWIYNPRLGKSLKLHIDIKEDWINNDITKINVNNKFSNFAISPDGKLLVFSYKFDLFAMPLKGGDVKQLTFDQAGVEHIVVAKDNKTVLYSTYVKGVPTLYSLDITEPEKSEEIVWLEGKYIDQIYSAQDNMIIHCRDKEWNRFVAIADSVAEKPVTWLKDFIITNRVAKEGKDLFYWSMRQPGWLSQLYYYDLDAKQEQLLLTVKGGVNNPFLNRAENAMFYTRSGDIFRLDLAVKEDFYDEDDNWSEILAEDKSKKSDKKDKSDKVDKADKAEEDSTEVTKALNLDLEDIKLRQTPIVNRSGYSLVVSIINDSTLVYGNYFEDKYNLRQCNFKGENDKLLKSFKDGIDHFTYLNKDKNFYYVVDDNLYKFNPKSKKATVIRNKFKYQYDKLELNRTIFDRVWTEFEEGFYNADMHGIEWDKSYNRFSKYLQFADNPKVLGTIVDEMIGEVDASHTGFYPRKENDFKTYQQAYLGIELDDSEGPDAKPTITKIYRKSKFRKPYNIPVGSKILSIDGIEISKKQDIVPLLIDKVREKITVEVETDDGIQELIVKGLSYWQQYGQQYDNWVEERRLKVEDWSDSKIGYLHIRSMDNRSYDQFVQDLFAENVDKAALIIDVRNNGGGNIHDRLLEDLTRESYGYQTNRIFHENKEKTPSRIWEKPLILLINENSFSDAEIFPNIFKFKNLGKVIGMPTSGSVIGTGHKYFMDGSSMRMPGSGWYMPDGTNMEGNGAQPDIYINPSPEDVINDNDVQLRKAVEELLKEI